MVYTIEQTKKTIETVDNLIHYFTISKKGKKIILYFKVTIPIKQLSKMIILFDSLHDLSYTLDKIEEDDYSHFADMFMDSKFVLDLSYEGFSYAFDGL